MTESQRPRSDLAQKPPPMAETLPDDGRSRGPIGKSEGMHGSVRWELMRRPTLSSSAQRGDDASGCTSSSSNRAWFRGDGMTASPVRIQCLPIGAAAAASKSESEAAPSLASTAANGRRPGHCLLDEILGDGLPEHLACASVEDFETVPEYDHRPLSAAEDAAPLPFRFKSLFSTRKAPQAVAPQAVLGDAADDRTALLSYLLLKFSRARQARIKGKVRRLMSL